MQKTFWKEFASRSNTLADKNVLKNSKVSIFGIGGIGFLVFEKLLREGVGNFCIADKDTVEISNLGRGSHISLCLGSFKVASAAWFAAMINPYVAIKPWPCDLLTISDSQLVDFVGNSNVIVCSADDSRVHQRTNKIFYGSKDVAFPIVTQQGAIGEIIWTSPGKTKCLECCSILQERIDYGVARNFAALAVDFDSIANITARVVISRLLYNRRGATFFPETSQPDCNFLLVGSRRESVLEQLPRRILSAVVLVETSGVNRRCGICGRKGE